MEGAECWVRVMICKYLRLAEAALALTSSQPQAAPEDIMRIDDKVHYYVDEARLAFKLPEN